MGCACVLHLRFLPVITEGSHDLQVYIYTSGSEELPGRSGGVT